MTATSAKPEPYKVIIEREPYSPCFVLTTPDGSSIELDPDETRHWFKIRNANVDKVEDILDWVWNLYHGVVYIQNPRIPIPKRDRLDPKI